MEHRFDHENLDVYRLALEVARGPPPKSASLAHFEPSQRSLVKYPGYPPSFPHTSSEVATLAPTMTTPTTAMSARRLCPGRSTTRCR